MDHNSRERARGALMAQDILDGKLDPLEGARELLGFRWYAEDADDPAFLRLSGIVSETDDLPIGKERVHWNAQALREKDLEIKRVTALYKSNILKSCAEIIELFRIDAK